MVDISASAHWAKFSLHAGLALLILGGCTPEETGSQLRVDLITDFLPGTQFDAVRVSIGEGDIQQRFDHVAEPDRDYVRGVALGDIRVPATEQAIRVSLFRDGGAIISRQVSVTVRGSITIGTVVITRNCEGVMCPGSGDNPLLASCLSGRCADPRCTVETPEFCPPGACMSAGECDPHVCAEATCITGACLYDPDDGQCDVGQRCDVDLGCVDSDFDAGMPDAGSPDVGFPDVRLPDVMMSDAGPDIPDVPAPDVFDAGPPPGCSGPDVDTLFLYNFESTTDLVDGAPGTLRDAAELSAGSSPCGGSVLSTPGPLESRFVIPDEDSFRLGEGSLDFWVRRPTELTDDSVGLVSRDEINTNTAGQVTLFYSRDRRLVLRGQQSATVNIILCAADPFPAEEWARIGINWGPGGLEFYVNGVLQMAGGTVNIFGSVISPCDTSTMPFSIAPTQDPVVLGASSQLSVSGTDEPSTYPGPGWRYDHFRLSRVQRDYTSEL